MCDTPGYKNHRINTPQYHPQAHRSAAGPSSPRASASSATPEGHRRPPKEPVLISLRPPRPLHVTTGLSSLWINSPKCRSSLLWQRSARCADCRPGNHLSYTCADAPQPTSKEEHPAVAMRDTEINQYHHKEENQEFKRIEYHGLNSGCAFLESL